MYINMHKHKHTNLHIQIHIHILKKRPQICNFSLCQKCKLLASQLPNYIISLIWISLVILYLLTREVRKVGKVGKVGVRQHLQFLSKRGKLCFLPQLSFPRDQLCLNLNCIYIYKIYTKEREIMLSQSLGVGLCPWGQLLCLSTATQNYNRERESKYAHGNVFGFA